MKPNDGLVLAFDYGLTWIGVAIGQRLTGTATPLEALKARDGIPDWNFIEKLILEWKPAVFLVGKPLNMDGTDSEMSQRAVKFGNRLHGRFGLPIFMSDERLTSFEAKGMLLDSNRGNRDFKKRQIDSLSATLIFESWCHEQFTD